MLVEIYINNFVLIDKLRLQFSGGLNVLSGETGAGKSIIIDALGLVLGERVKSDYIRDDSRKAVVEAVFDLESNTEAAVFLREQGLVEEDTDLIISREVYPGGRTAARINGRTVTVSMLKTLSSYLVDMHLQNDRHNFLRPVRYLDYVDSFAEDIDDLLQKMTDCYATWNEKIQELQDLRINEQERIQRVDFLAYQIKEISAANLCEGEDEELSELRDRIKNSQRLLEGSSRMLELLYSSESGGSAYDKLSCARELVDDLKADSFFAGIEQSLNDMYYSLQDLSEQLASFRDSLEFEPGLLEEVEDRLYEINKLKNKYGNDISEILQFLERARQEFEKLDSIEEKQEEIEKAISKYESSYMQVAGKVSEYRKKAARLMEQKVYDELKDLNMPHIKFKVDIKKKDKPAPRGIDDVDFLFSPNPGEEMRPVSKIASGGELSRFILALKKALAEAYNVPSLIFDEIDVGLGGSALSAMSKKIAELSRSHQVILITHSPQLASYADRHFLIEKFVENEHTFTRVKELQSEERTAEIARMLDGDNYSDLTVEHATEMLKKAQVNNSVLRGRSF